MHCHRSVALLFLLLTSFGCGDGSSPTLSYGGGDYDLRVRSRDLVRTALVHVSPTASREDPAPLLVALHGTGGTGAGMRAVTGLDSFADEEGMLVAYPDAISGLWIVGLEESLDLDFLSDLVDRIDEEIRIDRTRVYLTGFSRGALLAMKAACERPALVQAVAPVGAPVRTDIVADCQEAGPRAAIFFLGDEDQFYDWEGSISLPDSVLGGVESGAWWAGKNGCDPEPIVEDLPDLVDDQTTVERWIYQGCPVSAPLEFYAIRGGDHTWPGSPMDQGFLGRVSMDIVASSLIVEFFAPLVR